MTGIISIKRDLMTIFALVLMGVGLLCAGMLTSTSVKEIQLMRNAESEAGRWARDLTRLMELGPEDARRGFYDRGNFIKRPLAVSRVFAFDVFDVHGNLYYSAGPSNWATAARSQRILESPVTFHRRFEGKMTAQLPKNRGPAAVSDYASVVIPFHSESEYIGSIVTYVDQSAQARHLTTSFRIIAGVTGVLLLVAFGVPSLLVILRTRDRVKAEDRVRFLSGHDELTGLPNRKSFNQHLENALEARKAASDHLAVVIIDIDRFKEINDALGHGAGDSVLRYATEVLKSNIREGDFAARIGSDHFALALSSIKRPQQAAVFVATLCEALSAPLWIGGEQVSCALSAGIAVAPGDAEDAAILMRHANLALGRAKADGGNTFKFFEHGMDTAFIRRRDCEADLRRAIDADQFELAYQPIVDLAGQKVCGFEALIRWNHPNEGNVSPAFFIPLAEETGLIIPIGEWVLRRACRDAAAWPEPVKVSVNLSPVQFKRGNIVALVRDVLEETGLDPGRLELEITENLLIKSTGKVAGDLEGLRKLGVSIAMDDFGTGYSSLSYISSFPFNKIKIDKSFVHSMTRDKAIHGIIKCIIAMGRSLGVAITAEGVETAEEARILKGLGCQQAQGFYFGRPAGVAQCARRIARPLKLDESGAKESSRDNAAVHGQRAAAGAA